MRRTLLAISLGAVFLFGGCKSAYIEATVHNGTGAAISLLEVDYPSASFGKEQLAAGADFRYRFKILGKGPTKVLWTDAARQEHTVSGPDLSEGQQGSLMILLDSRTASWQTNFTPAR